MSLLTPLLTLTNVAAAEAELMFLEVTKKVATNTEINNVQDGAGGVTFTLRPLWWGQGWVLLFLLESDIW